MIIHNIEQGTEEWQQVRRGKMTASHAQTIASNGKGLETYCREVVASLITGISKSVDTIDTQRGVELEPVARQEYENEKGVSVEQVGFIEYNEFVGVSPDGLVGSDGLIEIKCKNDNNYLAQLLDGEAGIESKYIWQMQMQMLVSNRSWCDFVCYNPNFEKKLFIQRIYADERKFSKLLAGFESGEEIIKNILEKIKL